jgi:phenylalanyl-tRNA synthetase alpha chain
MTAVAISAIGESALQELANAGDRETIDAIQVAYLGRKGKVTLFLRHIGELPAAQRAEAGRLANQVKRRIEQAVDQARNQLDGAASRDADRIDVSLPGRVPALGRRHPLTQTMDEICAIFGRLGFAVAEGPEVEMDYYNFEALNIPANHPARDMQDTFYVSEAVLLRTHTSPVQIRTMEKQTPPVRVIAPGKVYRCDSDLTHTPMFHQVEGLLVDDHVTFGDLKGTLTAFVHEMFDRQTGLRFRPSFFPFTEPSAEVDIVCVMCRGRGCRVCSSTGWLEVLGSGMVHPALFENVGYPPGRYTGFAFGMGVERIAMLKFGIDDIRKFFDNDLRFLQQF